MSSCQLTYDYVANYSPCALYSEVEKWSTVCWASLHCTNKVYMPKEMCPTDYKRTCKNTVLYKKITMFTV